MPVIRTEQESEPEFETEVWQEAEKDPDLMEELESPSVPSNLSLSDVSRGSRLLAIWLLKFLMFMQATFRLSDAVINHMLRFFGVFFTILGRMNNVGTEISQCLPISLYKAKQLENELKFERHVVCRKCHAIYDFSECVIASGSNKRSKNCSFSRFPNHTQYRMRAPCNALLLKTVELASGRIFLYPYLTFCYLSPQISLESLLNQPNFFSECEKWRSRHVTEGVMKDVYDARIWNDFLNYDGEAFLSEPGNCGFILNFDFFQPYKHINYSVGAIYMSILNLPRATRYKKDNCLLVGLIPGPKEPHDINSFLRPFVADLIKLWAGVEMNKRKVRCALLCVACDIPAGRKLCGFLSFTAHLGCSRCLKEFPGTFGCMEYGGFDRQNWPLRTGTAHQQNAKKLRSAKTANELEAKESSSGCKFSELLELPYFDAPRMLIIDPMHNLFLGSAKRFFKKVLIDHLALCESHFSLIQNRVDTFIVPSGIGRIPVKIQSGFASFTADQWKNWVLYFSIISLRNIVTGDVLECWRHFVLACRVLCCKSLSNDQVKLGDALLLQFCRRTENLFGSQYITPNMHLHCHLHDCILDYGPLHGFWCYAFERYNGILGAMPNNKRSIETQLMQRFLRENQILSSPFLIFTSTSLPLYFREFKIQVQ